MAKHLRIGTLNPPGYKLQSCSQGVPQARAATSTLRTRARSAAVSGLAPTSGLATWRYVYSLKPKDEKLKKPLKLKTESSSLEHHAPKTYLRMSTSQDFTTDALEKKSPL